MTDQHATELMPASVREWTDILARIRFGKVKVAGKTLSGATIKGVAARLASYADGNGTRVRPGVARLAVDLEVDYHTARRAVSHLRAVGLLSVERLGGRRGADEYRLSLPVDLLERDDLTVWSPTEQRAEIERCQDGRRGTPPTAPRGPGGGRSLIPEGSEKRSETLIPEGSVEPVSLIPQGSAQAPSGPSIADPSGTPKNAIADPSGTPSLIPQGSATHQDLDTTTTHHPDEALRTAVTLPGAEAVEEPDFSPRPKRCAHGLTGRLRSDGLPACAICRRADQRPPGDRLAPVVDLRTREVS